MPAQGHVPEASRTGLPASGAAKPGVWPAGALRSGSQVGVTGQCLGAHQPPPTSLLLLETPASWLEFRAGFTATPEDVCAFHALIFLGIRRSLRNVTDKVIFTDGKLT